MRSERRSAAAAEERRLVRQQKSRPLADGFEVWLRAKLRLISQKIKLAEAIRYAFSRWQGLTRFIDEGRIESDNNTVEDQFVASSSVARTGCLLDLRPVPQIGSSLRIWSRLASSTTSLRSPISLTS
jgi:hypothetical protein